MLTYAVSGSSSALVAQRLVLLIDIPLDEAAEMWHTMSHPDATFEGVLTELMRQGLVNLRDFAIAELADPALGRVSVAVRGRGAVQLGDDVVTGRGASTWIEESSEQVRHMTLTLDEPAHDVLALPINHGIVHTSQLVWGNEPPDHFSETVTTRADTDTETAPKPDMFRDRAASLHEHGAPRETAPKPIDPGADHTTVRRALPNWMLRFTSGKVIGIGERVVLGRRPTPITMSGEQLEALLAPRREVSANHALLVGQEEGVRLTDLLSKNGTRIRTREGETFTVTDGASYMVREGDRLDFGDGNEAECVRAVHPRV